MVTHKRDDTMNKTHTIKIDEHTFKLLNEVKNKYYPDNTDDLVIFLSVLALRKKEIIEAK
jgi:hypothetical protein